MLRRLVWSFLAGATHYAEPIQIHEIFVDREPHIPSDATNAYSQNTEKNTAKSGDTGGTETNAKHLESQQMFELVQAAFHQSKKNVYKKTKR